ncbi:MAG: DUF885 family protein, partial [Nocardioidaceae bacterium]
MNPDDTPQPGALPRVRQIADQYMEVLADLDPRAAGALGRSDGVRIPDLTPDAFAERNELDRRTLQVLQDTSPASEEGQRLRAVMRERLSSDVALYDAGFTTRLLAPLATPVHGVRTVFDNLPRESRADWERVCEHLHLVPSALAGYEQTLAGAARQGHVVARRQIETMAVQCE